jgi:hypothetical protein
MLSLFNGTLLNAVLQSAAVSSPETPELLLLEIKKKEETQEIVFYPVTPCICKSICIYLGEWLLLGIIRLTDDKNITDKEQVSAVSLIKQLFALLMDKKSK